MLLNENIKFVIKMQLHIHILIGKELLQVEVDQKYQKSHFIGYLYVQILNVTTTVNLITSIITAYGTRLLLRFYL